MAGSRVSIARLSSRGGEACRTRRRLADGWVDDEVAGGRARGQTRTEIGDHAGSRPDVTLDRCCWGPGCVAHARLVSLPSCDRRAAVSYVSASLIVSARFRPPDPVLAALDSVRDVSTTDPWPDLTLSAWAGTRDTLHMWTQIVGKIGLALAPMLNHWWQVPLHVTARGLTTSLLPTNGRGLELEFDFVDHSLQVRTSDGGARQVALEPRTVANFYEATMAALTDLDVHVEILARPVEVVESIPFAEDTRDAYDADAAHRFWIALVQAHRVMSRFRGGFVGKASPVHFFWGGPDLAVTRFSGRAAPRHPGGVPNCADWVQQLAYSHEVSSCGFWPGGSAEGSFYSYAYPEPAGFAQWPVRPDAAFYDPDLHEFLLPYAAVRTAADPDATLLAFLEDTYEAAAELASWDRDALEAPT
jgi:hypothetical protein